MVCIPAPSCKALLAEATERWPARSRLSDGICASPQHTAQNPTSDHELGNAADLTHDPAHGVDCHVLSEHVSDDPRVKYTIWNRRIKKPGRAWLPYTGVNPHTKHMHVSIKPEARDATGPWFALPATPLPDIVQEVSPMDFVGQLPTPEGDGCWILLADGAVHTGGNAQYFGGANQHMNPLDRAKEILPRAGGLYGYTILTVQSPVIGFTYPADGSSGVPKPPVNQQLGVDRALVAQVAALEQTLAIIRVQAAELVATAG